MTRSADGVRTVNTQVVYQHRGHHAHQCLEREVNEVDSYFDPQVKFLEAGVAENGIFTMKTHGPDLNGTYGGMQGIGGIESLYLAGDLHSTVVIQNIFGDAVAAGVKEGTVTLNPARFDAFGSVPGYQTPAFSSDFALEQTLGRWCKRTDETGLIYYGNRYYDPVAGRFISHDPMASTPQIQEDFLLRAAIHSTVLTQWDR